MLIFYLEGGQIKLEYKEIILEDVLSEIINTGKIESIYLFGSRAYKTNSTRSDIDIILYGKEVDHVFAKRFYQKYKFLDIFIGDKNVISSPINQSTIKRKSKFKSLLKQLEALKLWDKKRGFYNRSYLHQKVYEAQSFLLSAQGFSEEFKTVKKLINNPKLQDRCKYYLNESLTCYVNNCITGSVSMVGCVCELLIDELIDGCIKQDNALNSVSANFATIISAQHGAKQRLNQLDIYFRNNKTLFNSLGYFELDVTMKMFDVVRQYRNNADHPLNFQFEKGYCDMIFMQLGLHLEKILNLIEYLNITY